MRWIGSPGTRAGGGCGLKLAYQLVNVIRTAAVRGHLAWIGAKGVRELPATWNSSPFESSRFASSKPGPDHARTTRGALLEFESAADDKARVLLQETRMLRAATAASYWPSGQGRRSRRPSEKKPDQFASIYTKIGRAHV